MITKRKRLKITSYVIGLCLVFLAFFIDHIDQIPFLEKIIFPKNYYVTDALYRLDNEETISKNEPAFSYILSICPPSSLNIQSITGLNKGTTTIDFTRANSQNSFGVHLIIDGNSITRDPVCSSLTIKNNIEHNKITLFIGFILVILGYAIK